MFPKFFSKKIIWPIIIGLLLILPAFSFEASVGFLYDQFPLTLEPGQRTEAAGPFFYSEKKEGENTWAIPPFFSHYTNSAVGHREDDFLYPLLTYERYGDEYRWQLFQLFAFAGGREPDEFHTRQFTLFPIYFQQRSQKTNLNYTALVPFYGHLQNRLFRDQIFFAMFPVYSETRRKDVVTDNYFYPFVSVANGDGLHGWQVWPFVGKEQKFLTTLTNGFGDVSIIGGHDRSFVLWPFWFKQNNEIGTDDPEKFRASIPAFVVTRSPQRDVTSVLWPFFSWIEDREKKYHEWEGPWPFVIFTRGEGKTTSRVFPIFSQSRNPFKESDSYLWPVYRYKRLHSDPLDQQRLRILVYLYEDTIEKNTQTGAQERRVDMLPFFTWRRDFNGNERLQILAPIEPVLPNNRGVERNWSPLWSLWRAEQNPREKKSSESLLWNLYRQETAPAHKKVSLLFGLFQYQNDDDTKQTRLFYLKILQTHKSAR
jgi:hypothetical protein